MSGVINGLLKDKVHSPKLTVAFSQSSYIVMTYRVVGKTVLMATHAVHLLDRFDSVPAPCKRYVAFACRISM
eukprot:COSAG03_NODE_1549_length_3888_cov_2.020042_3_plen_72_part_00